MIEIYSFANSDYVFVEIPVHIRNRGFLKHYSILHILRKKITSGRNDLSLGVSEKKYSGNLEGKSIDNAGNKEI